MRQKYGCNINELLQHIDNSSDLSDKYREWAKANAENNDKIDFSIQILTRGSWAFSQCNFSVPSNLDKYVQGFTNFFVGVNSGRKLIWLYDMGKGEIVFNSIKNWYTIQTSTFQMAVLLQFNEKTSLTIQQLGENTGIAQDILLPVLQSLLKSKLLICSDDASCLTTSSVIELFLLYENNKFRIDINVPLKGDLIEHETTPNIDEDRKLFIQTTIVRIMKLRRVLNQHNLIEEVLTQLSTRFQPKVSAIKICIDILIDKNYLEQMDGHNDNYIYSA